MLLSSAQVYAMNALDSDLITLFKSVLAEEKTSVNDKMEKELNGLEHEFGEKVIQFVKGEKESIRDELTSEKDNEIERAKNELNTYFEETTGEIEAISSIELAKAKEEIKDNVNKKIEHIEKKMIQDLKKELSKKGK